MLLKGKHIKIMIDNTTAVSVINNMGTCDSYPCNSIVACKIGHCVRKMVFGPQQRIFLAKKMLLVIMSLDIVI